MPFSLLLLTTIRTCCSSFHFFSFSHRVIFLLLRYFLIGALTWHFYAHEMCTRRNFYALYNAKFLFWLLFCFVRRASVHIVQWVSSECSTIIQKLVIHCNSLVFVFTKSTTIFNVHCALCAYGMHVALCFWQQQPQPSQTLSYGTFNYMACLLIWP